MSFPPTVDPILARAQARVGITLRDKWRLDRLLGVGGMAAVYAGTHRNGSRGAIKMLHLELSLDAEVKRRFLREGYLANTVDHPGVVRVIDDDVADDGSVFLVMELLQGETLDSRWERSGHQLPANEVLSIVDLLLGVLAAAHEKGIVHRDIKPENVFVNYDGSVKLLDFGIARMRDSVTTATRTGSAMGTPAFMPPEQALGRTAEVGPRSDIWSVGAMMFTVLSGRFVHPGETANEQLVVAATQQAPPLETVLPSVHPAVARVVDIALSYSPANRWPDALGMQEAVREAYHLMSGSPVQTAPRLAVPDVRASLPDLQPKAATETTGATSTAERPATPSIHRTHTAPIAIGAAIGLLGLLSAVVMFVKGRPTDAPSQSVSAPVSAAPADAPSAPAVPAPAPEPASSSSAPTPAGSAAPQEVGHLKVVVSGGSCSLSVDGLSYGTNPVSMVDLSPGKHDVVCAPAKGKAQATSVRIKSGSTTTVPFSFATPSAKERRK